MGVKEKRRQRAYKVADSFYTKAMIECSKKGIKLANEVEKTVALIAKGYWVCSSAELGHLAKDLNRVTAMCNSYKKSNDQRKYQIKLWGQFIEKLLSEGRITKDELKPYSPRKK